MSRGISYNRFVSYKKSKRKQKIINNHNIDWYDNLHQYSKNKIHCSCPLCRSKTNNKGKLKLIKGRKLTTKNYKISDYNKFVRLYYEE